MSELLSKKEIEQFIHTGYIRLDDVFSKNAADAVLDILWNDLPYDRSNPSTWMEPVIRLGDVFSKAFC